MYINATRWEAVLKTHCLLCGIGITGTGKLKDTCKNQRANVLSYLTHDNIRIPKHY